MKSYTNFIGIDIGKFEFVVAIHGEKNVRVYDNTPLGIDQFLKKYKKLLPNALCVLEPTGGYEMRLLLCLAEEGFAVHRAHTRKVKNFIRSYGNEAKTDKLDAKSLSLYGFERSNSLEKFLLPSKNALNLYELVQRRHDLKQMLVAEKNRLQSPRSQTVKNSIHAVIDTITVELEALNTDVNMLIEDDVLLKERKKILKTIPGIGEIIANDLLVLLPELGHLSRKQIALLAGVAPISKDSGKKNGYRKTNYGRGGIKPMLFLAAMAARNSKSWLKEYYVSLIKRGKSKMVALTALMRKIIVIANARLRIQIET